MKVAHFLDRTKHSLYSSQCNMYIYNWYNWYVCCILASKQTALLDSLWWQGHIITPDSMDHIIFDKTNSTKIKKPDKFLHWPTRNRWGLSSWRYWTGGIVGYNTRNGGWSTCLFFLGWYVLLVEYCPVVVMAKAKTAGWTGGINAALITSSWNGTTVVSSWCGRAWTK